MLMHLALSLPCMLVGTDKQQTGECIMSNIEMDLIRRAREKFTTIYPCSTKSSFDECFTRYGQKYVFWFNTGDNSTHVVMSDPVLGE